MSNANSNDVSAQILPPCKNPHLCSCGTNFCHALSSTQKNDIVIRPKIHYHQPKKYISIKQNVHHQQFKKIILINVRNTFFANPPLIILIQIWVLILIWKWGRQLISLGFVSTNCEIHHRCSSLNAYQRPRSHHIRGKPLHSFISTLLKFSPEEDPQENGVFSIAWGVG